MVNVCHGVTDRNLNAVLVHLSICSAPPQRIHSEILDPILEIQAVNLIQSLVHLVH